ncbi:MAG: hypothetical protein CVU56_17985 [Deltaproteobacteria bacterium HGW-Deltaproteobacteria-14]|jgi:predicted flap endonuclease-1-like 5' DNA nuclease|nr:MAG: hypothetical protein CVU56_17985 [Deltaproteobacteria bacterium HGW-Deltaproteobacteria-14]
MNKAPRLARHGARALLVAVATLTVVATSGAHASHYRLPADGLVTGEEHAALKRVKVLTTLDLLRRAARVSDRESLARDSGLPLARLTTLACQADLLRIKGLGPSMVRLLQTAGIRHTRDLGATEPDGLLERLRAANSIHNIAPVLPQRAILEDWIDQAKRLDWTLEGTQ